MKASEASIQNLLFSLQDKGYADFQRKLMPTVAPETVIGVRMPELRKLARELASQGAAQGFLARLPHRYYEENNLHGLLICALADYGALIAALASFLPCVDNWATCDLLSPVAFRSHPPALSAQIECWLRSDHCYTQRFGIGMLLRFYLDGAFQPEQLTLVAALQSEEYYVNMMRAWYFATALAKQPAAALPLLRGQQLDKWTHNKSIQKAVESHRIPAQRKCELRALRRS